MTMTLFERIATLLKADAHGVIESLEERSLLLKQYVREAEIELNRKRARLEAVRDEEKRLREALGGCESELHALDEDIALALAAGKDDLARFAIRRLIPRRDDAAALRAQIGQRGEEARTLSERLARQQAQFDSLRVRVRAELARATLPDTAAARPCEGGVADEEVELELMRRRRGEGGRP
jgi:phage shock protein A